MPADRTQADQGVGKVPKPIPTCLSGTLLENVGKHCLKWPGGKTESEIKFLIQENSKPQDLIVYTDGPVTKDLSQCGFTVKQGATTNHEIYAAYTVSTSTLTMTAEAVTQACKNEALDDLPRKYV